MTERVFVEVLQADGELRLWGTVRLPAGETPIPLYASLAGRRVAVEFTGRYGLYPDDPDLVNHAFEVRLPLGYGVLRFLDAEGRKPIDFARPKARLANLGGSWFAVGEYLFARLPDGVRIVKNGRRLRLRNELKFLFNVLRYARPQQKSLIQRIKRPLGIVAMRLAYWATRRRYAGKRIWIYYDKLYRRGDNGEYAFRYASAQDDGIEKHYLVTKGSPAAASWPDGPAYTEYRSPQAMLAFLHAEIVFQTHIHPTSYGGFAGVEQYFRTFYDYTHIGIQHGLTVQDLAATVNFAHDATDYYCLAAPVEHAALSAPEYGYRPAQLIPTGLARFDGLRGDTQPVILIAPTWRSYLAADPVLGHAREFSPALHESEYVRIYAALLADEKLLAACRERGYRIRFVLHPVFGAQAADFTGNDVVEIVSAAGDFSYEQALSEAALLVTDFSGIQFDFAYQYKPVLYFQPPELPPSYTSAHYSYARDALGEVVAELPTLVNTLVNYLAADCALPDEYRERIDAFFYFHDAASAKRIYDFAAAL
ncbi:MAG: CDP-glycerol glycerophosphotransferase family protein [Propionibacteriaceae bacterium]|nr:CDP-glycerol glycerophosphotransferase family protein [Propionibacteriaceae bacterium]